ncbi:MAG TPA: hypothetical protein VGO53_04975 [Steroidobacteraceae bacterium]|jgi:hypothetical protein|nr:hypothetical protein [Steroidobacteraceae bacterium]
MKASEGWRVLVAVNVLLASALAWSNVAALSAASVADVIRARSIELVDAHGPSFTSAKTVAATSDYETGKGKCGSSSVRRPMER